MKKTQEIEVTVELDSETIARLEYWAKKYNSTISDIIKNAVEEKIEDFEDIVLAKRAEKTWQEIQSGKTKTIPVEEVFRELGL